MEIQLLHIPMMLVIEEITLIDLNTDCIFKKVVTQFQLFFILLKANTMIINNIYFYW